MDSQRQTATEQPMSPAKDVRPARSTNQIHAVPSADRRPATGMTGRLTHIATRDPLATVVSGVAPLLGVNDDLTPATEHGFFPLAVAAQAGDGAARDILYTALQAKLDRFVTRTSRLAWDTGTTRRNGVPWAIEDLEQEHFPIFVDLLQSWDGQRPSAAICSLTFPGGFATFCAHSRIPSAPRSPRCPRAWRFSETTRSRLKRRGS